MPQATLEHINFTTTDPKATANRLCSLFDWKIRWEGGAIHEGFTVHVGSKDSYLAIYSKGNPGEAGNSYDTKAGLNHIGIVVEDLDLIEKRVKDAGFETHSHANYEPGKRFYFHDPDGIEFEIISYE